MSNKEPKWAVTKPPYEVVKTGGFHETVARFWTKKEATAYVRKRIGIKAAKDLMASNDNYYREDAECA